MKNPVDVASVLARHYGHKLEHPVVYTQGVALSGRLRLADLVNGPSENTTESIEQVVDPYVTASSAETGSGIFSAGDGTANYAGLCWADELAVSSGNASYTRLLHFAADQFGPTLAEGPLDPDIRVEDFFFAATMLGRAYRSSGEESYANLLADFLTAPETLGTLQPSGLWWHSKTSPYFWGRGNAFAALGFAETLTYLPEQHPARPKLLATHVKHLEGLSEHQDASGMWRQIVDLPETYLEHSASSMIGYSVARGIRMGWLDDSWRAMLNRTWDGASRRIGEDGSIEHVCVGTGPQSDLEAYVNRPYSDGLDDRGGAMALWFAVEMARLQADK
ncbi:MAG: glycoside hydrolase family 88 protein [Chloroflexi bacterium]|nr:glycoside hydrolase family 88 protein [Chloroflexota bacterium]